MVADCQGNLGMICLYQGPPWEAPMGQQTDYLALIEDHLLTFRDLGNQVLTIAIEPERFVALEAACILRLGETRLLGHGHAQDRRSCVARQGSNFSPITALAPS